MDWSGRIKWRWGCKRGVREGIQGKSPKTKGHLKIVWKPTIVEAF